LAWANDLDKPLIKEAVAAGYGHHGELENQLKVCKFLLEDGLDPGVANGVLVGISQMDDKRNTKIAKILLQALLKGGIATGVAGRLMVRHASTQEHIQAMIDAYAIDANRADAATKAGLLYGLGMLLDNKKIRKVKSFKDALKNWKLKK
jgi:hypothetical protein